MWKPEGMMRTTSIISSPKSVPAAAPRPSGTPTTTGLFHDHFPPEVLAGGFEGADTLVGIARQRGVAGHVGDGTNRWPAVHRSDAARLARLAVEAAPAGSVLHAVGDQGEHFAHLGHFVALDSPATADITRDLLPWEPTGPSLLEDLGQDHYYRQA
jgi:hypothetical protein